MQNNMYKNDATIINLIINNKMDIMLESIVKIRSDGRNSYDDKFYGQCFK